MYMDNSIDFDKLYSGHQNKLSGEVDFNFVYIGEESNYFTHGDIYPLISIKHNPYHLRILNKNGVVIALSKEGFKNLFVTKNFWRKSKLDEILNLI